MRVFDFHNAIVRGPGRSVVNGIRSDPLCIPDLEMLLREHSAYITEMRTAGLEVEILPPLERYPDSVFVEDPALVFPEGAILLRPGTSARLGECDELRPTLQKRFERVLELRADEFVDGGDVLVTPHAVFVGLSRRTNRKGAEALCEKLEEFGRAANIVESPNGVLHLKTAASLLDEETILLTRAMVESGIFDRFRSVVVPPDEEGAANSLRANEVVLAGDCFPRTIELIRNEGLRVATLPVAEIAKLDAGLSCMSLRW